ncbi:hypothetical protein [Vibrio algivorus]|uniref:Uncharacterized protein n=1 Tax=Vibrio algivorus TaxID=1667024 RepID=A0A557PGX0_9VIBR|nr:hypothetical protein [Vibrio algivorus]TVO39900.1 hypothetical protein FOF44_00065 [Vibrio algivorus]
MQKYYRHNEIFIGLDERNMPLFIPLNIFMSDIMPKTIKLKKNSQGVSLQTLLEQVNQIQASGAQHQPPPKRQDEIPPLTIEEKQCASDLMAQFESRLQSQIHEKR